ncbi:sulfatase-like hydrolase/transferase [Paenibacillus pectinilyticus]|nr:sulfatase-like hydrolase/transferase [Paenibacillus pectinilyticus]
MSRPNRPNMLIFMTDQQQAQVIDERHPCRTPHLNQFAREGITFDRTYTTMAHCCPSRASFFTSLYPSQHGIHNNVCTPTAIQKALNPGVETFGEKLRDAGYSLHFTGKWHISTEENPADRGWEELKVTAGKDVYMGASIAAWQEMEATVKSAAERKPGELLRPGWDEFVLYGTADKRYEETDDYDVVTKAKERLAELKGAEQPWCMYVGVLGPHDPFIVPEKYAKMYKAEEVELPPNYHDSLQDKPRIYERMRRVWDQLSEQEVKESIAHYWGYCTMVDDMFGEVLEALERTGQADNTLVVFLSDHGESGGAHGLYLKGISPYEETYRIPCVVRWPEGIVQPGRHVESLVSIMDLAPTFMAVADAGDLNGGGAGRSLLPWLRNENVPAENWRDAVYNQCNGVEIYYTQRMVRTERYKFVYNPADFDELYDLQEDPYEMINLAGDPARKPLLSMLYQKMWQEAAANGDRIFNQYPSIAMADVGPALAIGREAKRD